MIVNNMGMTFECVNTHETEVEEEAYGVEITSHRHEPLPQGGAAPAEQGFPWCWHHLVAMLMDSEGFLRVVSSLWRRQQTDHQTHWIANI